MIRPPEVWARRAALEEAQALIASVKGFGPRTAERAWMLLAS